MKQKLLVSIRGPVEAIEAAKGGALIADVEYPASALGTPYPLNIHSVRERLNKSGFSKVKVSTNIGEHIFTRATSCQAALGVALAGADQIKFGLAEQSFESAAYLGESTVRTIRKWFNKSKLLIPAIFIDDDMVRFLNPFSEGVKLAVKIKSDAVLIDTYNKSIGKGLLDYCDFKDIKKFVQDCHKNNIQSWIAGSISKEELPDLWNTGVDVICVRGAACEKNDKGRFGTVRTNIVKELRLKK